MNPKIVASVLALVALPIGAGCASNDTEKVDAVQRLQVIFDYSPTLSDAGALLYLASNPAVDLMAVTLPGTGEADCEPGVRATRSLLAVVGYDSIPIACGRNSPLAGDRDWPSEWMTDVSRWDEQGLLPSVAAEPVIDAEQLLSDMLQAATVPITLVAVAPLTNLGAVLGDRPELAAKIERIVIMGGAVTVPGNVEASPAAEWNIYIDPEAGRRVIAAGVPVTLVALDATNYLPWSDRLLTRVGALDTQAAETVQQLATSLDTIDGIFLWDELAAMTAVTPGLVTVEAMTVQLNDDGAFVRDSDGYAVDVAIFADTETATHEFLETLNGQPLPPLVPLTPAELDYFIALGGADSEASASLEKVYGGFNQTTLDPKAELGVFVNGLLDVLDRMASDLRKVSPPPSLSKVHDDYVEGLAGIVAIRGEVLAMIAASSGTTSDEITEELGPYLFSRFEDAGAACQKLVEYSFLHSGPRPCSFE